jgi:hypothetical protein
MNPALLAFYVVGLIAACWHFAYGIWLFAAKWGITSGEKRGSDFWWSAWIVLLDERCRDWSACTPSANASRKPMPSLARLR